MKHVRTCVTIEEELLKLAKKYKINISRALEEKLTEILREEYGVNYVLSEHMLEEILKKRHSRRRKTLRLIIRTIKKLRGY